MEMFLPQIRDESREVGESLRIDSKRPILELVIDVKVKHVRGNPVGTQAVGDLAYLRFRSVAVPRLLEAQRPQWRKRRHSGEIRVAFHNLLRRWAIEHVVIERAALGAEGYRVPRLLAEVEPGAPCVVEKKAVAVSAADAKEKRNAFIERVDGFLRTDVGVPECEGLIPAVERSRFVAEAKIMLVARHLLGEIGRA